MNIKQKITYMLIGCLFTLAGFVLSSLFNTPPPIQAQDDKVIEEIVCKRLKIVNDEGTTVAKLVSFRGNGVVSTYNADGKGLIFIGSEIGGKSGAMVIRNADGKGLVGIGTSVDGKSGGMETYNADGKKLVIIGSWDGKSGSMAISNADGEPLIHIGSTLDNRSGEMSVFNADGSRLVHIGSIIGRPNDVLSTSITTREIGEVSMQISVSVAPSPNDEAYAVVIAIAGLLHPPTQEHISEK